MERGNATGDEMTEVLMGAKRARARLFGGCWVRMVIDEVWSSSRDERHSTLLSDHSGPSSTCPSHSRFLARVPPFPQYWNDVVRVGAADAD